MHKKAFIEVQLNWVYILIIGAIILVFFVLVGIKYMKQAELKINAEIINQLDTTIIGAAQAEKSAHVIAIEDASLSFSCSCKDSGCESKIEVGGSGIAKDIGAFPLFSVKTVQDSPLITWTMNWNAPFKVINLLYITRDDIHYYILAENNENAKQFAQQLFEQLQENKFLNVDILNNIDELKLIKADNLYLMRVLYITTTIENNLELAATKKAKNVDILFIQPLQENTGRIAYKKIKKNGKELQSDYLQNTVYLDTATLFAAIFAEDRESYSCNMNKAFKRYNIIKDILRTKAQQLAATQQYAHCQYYYNELVAALTTNKFFGQFEQVNAPESFVAETRKIEQLNEQLVVTPGGRCPTLY